ncbi:ABC transporter permease [Planctomycetota bacterium]
MAFRRQPLSLYTAALTVFFFAAILPIGCMLGQFIIRILQQPSQVANVLIDSRQLLLLSRSLLIAFSATLVAFGLGLPAAFILAARDLPFRRFFYLLVLVPVMIPSYVMAGAWIHLFSPSGFINSTLTNMFGPSVKLTLFSKAGCVWCLGISFFPIVAIIVATGLSKLDNNLEDIARLSTNRWGVFRHSTLPIIHVLSRAGWLTLLFMVSRRKYPSQRLRLLSMVASFGISVFCRHHDGRVLGQKGAGCPSVRIFHTVVSDGACFHVVSLRGSRGSGMGIPNRSFPAGGRAS